MTERRTPMPDRAALVTGASSGIGLAIADLLRQEGYALTVASRRPDKLSAAAEELRGKGYDIEEVAANLTDEEDVKRVVAAHRDRFGRLDVLVNSAGVGVGAPVAEIETKRADMHFNLNLRAIILFYRECAELLRAAGAEHRNALVINLSSIAGKSGAGWLSVYAATKAAVLGWTQSMNQELVNDGIKSVALCPGFVDTPMTDFVKGQVAPGGGSRPPTSPRPSGSSCEHRHTASCPRSCSNGRAKACSSSRKQTDLRAFLLPVGLTCVGRTYIRGDPFRERRHRRNAPCALAAH